MWWNGGERRKKKEAFRESAKNVRGRGKKGKRVIRKEKEMRRGGACEYYSMARFVRVELMATVLGEASSVS